MNNRTKSNIINIALILYSLLIVYWSANSYFGPVKFLNDIQKFIFGNYWQFASVMFLLASGTFLLAFIKSWICTGRLGSFAEISQSNMLDDSSVKYFLRPVGALIATIFITTGLSGQAFAPDLGHVNLKDIEAGGVSHNNYYAKISGYSDGKTLKMQKSSEIPRIYIPLYSDPTFSNPTRVIISVQENEIDRYISHDDPDKKISTTGYIDDAIQGSVKAWFEDKGIKIDPNVKSITPRIKSENRDTPRMIMFGIGLFGLMMSMYFFKKDCLDNNIF
jgi:hypothetical protein